PSACSASRGAADAVRVHRRAGAAAPRGARGARQRRLVARRGRGRGAVVSRPRGPVRGGRPRQRRRVALRRLASRGRAVRRAGARGGRHRREGARARRRVRVDARAVRAEDRRVPGRVAPARRHLRRDGARALARVLGCVVRLGGRRAGARGRRSREGVRRRRGSRSVRALDPGARRHRLHLGAHPPHLLQARTRDSGVRRLLARPPREGRRAPAGLNRGGREMKGQMMDFQLTLPPLLRRAETFFGDKEIVTRLPDKSFHRYTYRDMARRAKQLAVALDKAGLKKGDRVATLCWNHYQHMEAYFGIPCGGFVLHTLNLRLHHEDIGYIAKHGGDKAVIVDKSLLPLLDAFQGSTDIEHVFVVEDSYEELLATADADEWTEPALDEDDAP